MGPVDLNLICFEESENFERPTKRQKLDHPVQQIFQDALAEEANMLSYSEICDFINSEYFTEPVCSYEKLTDPCRFKILENLDLESLFAYRQVSHQFYEDGQTYSFKKLVIAGVEKIIQEATACALKIPTTQLNEYADNAFFKIATVYMRNLDTSNVKAIFQNNISCLAKVDFLVTMIRENIFRYDQEFTELFSSIQWFINDEDLKKIGQVQVKGKIFSGAIRTFNLVKNETIKKLLYVEMLKPLMKNGHIKKVNQIFNLVTDFLWRLKALSAVAKGLIKSKLSLFEKEKIALHILSMISKDENLITLGLPDIQIAKNVVVAVLAEIFALQGKLEEAEKVLEQAIEINSNDANLNNEIKEAVYFKCNALLAISKEKLKRSIPGASNTIKSLLLEVKKIDQTTHLKKIINLLLEQGWINEAEWLATKITQIDEQCLVLIGVAIKRADKDLPIAAIMFKKISTIAANFEDLKVKYSLFIQILAAQRKCRDIEGFKITNNEFKDHLEKDALNGSSTKIERYRQIVKAQFLSGDRVSSQATVGLFEEELFNHFPRKATSLEQMEVARMATDLAQMGYINKAIFKVQQISEPRFQVDALVGIAKAILAKVSNRRK